MRPLTLALLALPLAGCATAPPPYGLLTYDHDHHETLDPAGRVVARNCHTHVEGGVETAGAALQGQSCGDTIGGSTAGITAFAGQAIGAPLYAAKIQADAARDQALVAAGAQLGQAGICAGMIAAAGATAGAALPAALAPCLQALGGLGANTPTPAPPDPRLRQQAAPASAPPHPGRSLPAERVHRARGHVRTVDHAQAGALGGVWYRDEDGRPHVTSLPDWRAWEKG
jgi:hypothetical protein